MSTTPAPLERVPLRPRIVPCVVCEVIATFTVVERRGVSLNVSERTTTLAVIEGVSVMLPVSIMLVALIELTVMPTVGVEETPLVRQGVSLPVVLTVNAALPVVVCVADDAANDGVDTWSTSTDKGAVDAGGVHDDDISARSEGVADGCVLGVLPFVAAEVLSSGLCSELKVALQEAFIPVFCSATACNGKSVGNRVGDLGLRVRERVALDVRDG